MKRHDVEQKLSVLIDKAEELGFVIKTSRVERDVYAVEFGSEICAWDIDVSLRIK